MEGVRPKQKSLWIWIWIWVGVFWLLEDIFPLFFFLFFFLQRQRPVSSGGGERRGKKGVGFLFKPIITIQPPFSFFLFLAIPFSMGKSCVTGQCNRQLFGFTFIIATTTPSPPHFPFSHSTPFFNPCLSLIHSILFFPFCIYRIKNIYLHP